MPRITKSIEQLRKELAAKQRLLSRLQGQRGKASARLARIDRQITDLSGGAPRRGPGRPRKVVADQAPVRDGRRVPRRSTGKPLIGYVLNVLKKAKGPMRVKDVTAAILKEGYETHSKDFYGIVAATLRDNRAKFAHVGRGKYKLGG